MSNGKIKSMGMVGKKHSAEAKAQIAEAQKKRWAKFYADHPNIKRRDRRKRRAAEAAE